MRASAGPYIAAGIIDASDGILLAGDGNATFDAISTDSRDIRNNDLFVALVGDTFDGHDFLIPALEAGARGALVSRDVNRDILPKLTNHVLIQVQDTLRTLSILASTHRSIHSSPLIAVTGSSGKTTVKEMIAAVLGRSHRPLVSEGNLNNTIGLPMTVLNMNASHDVAVVEAGINMNGEMELLARAAKPDVGLITTIGPVHLEGLDSIENVAAEKCKLLKALPKTGTAVVPYNEPYLEPLLGDLNCRIVRFGTANGDYRAENVEAADRARFDMITPTGAVRIALSVPGEHMVANALAAAAACEAVGEPLDVIAEALEAFTPPVLRMETVPLSEGRVLIRDCYNANPQSMKAALSVLAGRTHAKKLALLADMKELGRLSDELHADIGRTAAELNIDRVVFVGSYGTAFKQGFLEGGGSTESLTLAEDKNAAWEAVNDEIDEYTAILVKGSRAMKMEVLADRITEVS